jgi:hypothetical protein
MESRVDAAYIQGWDEPSPALHTACTQVGAYSENVAGKVYQAASSALPRMILSAAPGDEEMVRGMHDLLQQWTEAEQAEVLFSAPRSIGGDVSLGFRCGSGNPSFAPSTSAS